MEMKKYVTYEDVYKRLNIDEYFTTEDDLENTCCICKLKVKMFFDEELYFTYKKENGKVNVCGLKCLEIYDRMKKI